jgi:cytochrome c-type biogenesis protein CcmH
MFALLALLSVGAQARVEVYKFDTPEQESSYKRLIEELRCLVCQNQNLADSNSDLAKDLRQKTYEMVIAGKDDQGVIDYMVERYGDFVLYRPPVNSTTLLLWVGPFFILFGGVAVLLVVIRRQRRAGATDEVDSDALRRVEKLLENEKDKSL